MISKFDDHFNKLLKNINSNNRFILGLSGGIDSMALLHLIKNFKADKRNVSINCMPVIIDHNLRDESEYEAKEAKKISQNLGFYTQIKKLIHLSQMVIFKIGLGSKEGIYYFKNA